jgi:hypothetical protein
MISLFTIEWLRGNRLSSIGILYYEQPHIGRGSIMLKMKHLVLGISIAAAVIAFAAVPVMADTSKAKKHSEAMLENAEDMVAHGEEGHMDILIKHAKEMIKHAKGTISSLHDDEHGKMAKKHIEMAIKEAESAIDHGGQGHPDVAMKHANSALEHAEEGDSHIGD